MIRAAPKHNREQAEDLIAAESSCRGQKCPTRFDYWHGTLNDMIAELWITRHVRCPGALGCAFHEPHDNQVSDFRGRCSHEQGAQPTTAWRHTTYSKPRLTFRGPIRNRHALDTARTLSCPVPACGSTTDVTAPAGELWSGILDRSRAIDWTRAGVVGGIPTAPRSARRSIPVRQRLKSTPPSKPAPPAKLSRSMRAPTTFPTTAS